MRRIQKFLSKLSLRELQGLYYDWCLWARDKQILPVGNWLTWMILAGRGWGKTRTGAEGIRQLIQSGQAKRIALVGYTWADVRDVMIEGESGILNITPPWDRPKYEPSKKRLEWPNGAIAYGFSACDPDQLRGHQFDAGWMDEVAKYGSSEAYEQLILGMRVGEHPRLILTTTPRPLRWLQKISLLPGTILTHGTSQENKSHLSESYLNNLYHAYAGTRLERQELNAEFVFSTPGALWTYEDLEAIRVKSFPSPERIVIAVDPAVGGGETGIIIAGGNYAHGKLQTAVILGDSSVSAPPDFWIKRVVKNYHDFQANMIVAEINQGGDLVESHLRHQEATIPFRGIRAKYGKIARAEPVAALYQQGLIRHAGFFPELEDQMCTFDGTGESPDRLDALVLALTYLQQPFMQRCAKITGY